MYRDLGLRRIATEAVGVGKYVWGRAGFDFADEVVAATVNSAVSRFALDMDLTDEPLPHFPHPWLFASLDFDEENEPLYVKAETLISALQHRRGNKPPEPTTSAGSLTISKALLIYADLWSWDAS